MSMIKCPSCGFKVSDEDGCCFICGRKFSPDEALKADLLDTPDTSQPADDIDEQDISKVFGSLSHTPVQAIFLEDEDGADPSDPA